MYSTVKEAILPASFSDSISLVRSKVCNIVWKPWFLTTEDGRKSLAIKVATEFVIFFAFSELGGSFDTTCCQPEDHQAATAGFFFLLLVETCNIVCHVSKCRGISRSALLCLCYWNEHWLATALPHFPVSPTIPYQLTFIKSILDICEWILNCLRRHCDSSVRFFANPLPRHITLPTSQNTTQNATTGALQALI